MGTIYLCLEVQGEVGTRPASLQSEHLGLPFLHAEETLGLGSFVWRQLFYLKHLSEVTVFTGLSQAPVPPCDGNCVI